MSIETHLADIRKNGFYTTGAKIRPDLFDQIARDLGEYFATGGQGTRRDTNRRKVSSNQLRGFFGEVKALETKLQTMSREGGEQPDGDQEFTISDKVFADREYLVRMIVPKVYYIQGKQTGGNVSKEFRDFIHACVDQISSARDFNIFMRLFESVVGFFYGFGGGRN